MTVDDFLGWLDGFGIIYTDGDLVAEELNRYGIFLNDIVTIKTPSGKVVLGEE